MSRKHWFVVFGGSALIGLAALALSKDQEVRSVIGNVFLQDTSPGIAQIGHANIKGTFRAGQVFVQQGTGTTTPVVGNNSAVGAGNAIGGSFSSSQQSGTGVRGTAAATQGETAGVYGETRSPSGVGVYGKSTAANSFNSDHAAGVFGEATASGVAGVIGRNPNGTGVFGKSSGTSSSGMTAFNDSSSGQGIYAQGKIGVFGTTNFNSGGAGVVGDVGADGLMGGDFNTSNAGGTGVRGTNSQFAGTGPGVLGRNLSGQGFAVFANGTLGASGTKSFVIDHPLDPEHMTLSHYCTEGEEPLNVYRGTVVTGTDGRSDIRLPSYFEAINTAPTVQLTVADSSDDWIMAKVTREVHDGTFQIRTSKPGTKVFWRVEARRNDPWVKHYGARVEQMKPRAKWGTYIRPELYGQPQTKSEDYEVDQMIEKAKSRSGR